MNIVLRPGQPADAESCGVICYEAFKAIADQHNFPADFPNTGAAIGMMHHLFSKADVYSVVAEADGKIVGSNFLWFDNLVAGVGPITIDPGHQNGSVGRKLMDDVIREGMERNMASVRLCQSAYHNRSFSLYSKLGFTLREPLAVLNGNPLSISFPAYPVRPAIEADLPACNQLCYEVHGHHRNGELSAAIQSGTAQVVEYNGKITGYSTQVGFFGHTVAAGNNELKALIGAAPIFAGPGFLLPSRNAEVFRWCVNQGLRVTQPMTLMSMGLYNEPSGAFLPSVLY